MARFHRTKPSKGGFEAFSKLFPDRSREDFSLVFPYDLDKEKAYGRQKGLFAFDGERIYIASLEGEREEIPLDDCASFFLQRGVGCGFFFVRMKDGEERLLCRMSASGMSRAGAAARTLNHRIESGETNNFAREEARNCPKCGRRFPKGSQSCVHCGNKRKIFMRLGAVISPYKWQLLFSVFLFLAVSLISIVNPYLNKILVDGYINNSEAAAKENVLFLFLSVIALILLAQLLQRGLSLLRGYIMIRTGNRVILHLRELVFCKIQELSVARISKRTSGELLNRVTRDTGVIQRFLTDRLTALLEQILMLAAVSVILFAYNWKLALLVIVPTPCVILSFRLFWRFMGGMFRRRWQLNSEANATLHDIFSGIRVVKSFGMEKREAERFEKITRREKEAQIRQEKAWAVIMPLLNFMMGVGEFFVLYFVGNEILSGGMTLGDMAMFSSYVGMVYAPLRSFAGLPRELLHTATAVSRVFELLDENSDVYDAANAVDMEIKGHIEVKNVSFGYEEGREVLRDISFDVKPGEFVGLVGPSGVGKSTMINLIMRMYDVDQGQILIDGKDIRELSQESLRSQMGVVLQETFLFSGSVAQNIAYAKPDATRDEIIAAAKLAGCHSFIIKMPDGYQTKVGEKGYTLSGGERQRVAIARALLHDPKILILDEATASLDTETEKQIQEALAHLSKTRTTIAIAHRLSTLRNATKLIVFDKGRIAEIGSHDELMAKEGIYYGLVLAQREMTKMQKEEGLAPKGAERKAHA